MVRQWGRLHCRTSPLACSLRWHLCAWSRRTSCCWISFRFSGSAVGGTAPGPVPTALSPTWAPPTAGAPPTDTPPTAPGCCCWEALGWRGGIDECYKELLHQKKKNWTRLHGRQIFLRHLVINNASCNLTVNLTQCPATTDKYSPKSNFHSNTARLKVFKNLIMTLLLQIPQSCFGNDTSLDDLSVQRVFWVIMLWQFELLH